jgi:iron complex outermembrane receptor protein
MSRVALPIRLGLLCALTGPGSPALAGDGAEAQLPEVSVRASGPQGGRSGPREAVHHLTVLQATDIERSGASSVGELLSVQGNLPLQSLSGHDKGATLDLRGMGPTANSNLLIVVDGVVVNENDLSGADLSSLSLSQIQRIEIVRGGGGVEHGSGAVAGVIRISTLPMLDEGESKLRLSLRGDVAGDRPGGRAWDLDAQRRVGEVSAALQLRRAQGRGHRDNSGLDQTLGALTLRWQGHVGSAPVDTHVKLTRQRDRYGLPGPVSLLAFEGSDADRQASRFPLDGGRTEVDRQDVGASVDLGRWGRTQWRSSHRDRHNPFVISADPDRPLAEQLDRIQTSQWHHRLSHRVATQQLGHTQELSLGWDQMQGELSRSTGGFQRLGGSLTEGRASSRATFAHATVRPLSEWALQAGVRWDRFRSERRGSSFDAACRFDNVFVPGLGTFPVQVCDPPAYAVTEPAEPRRWANRASELGLSWQATPALQAFVSRTRTFRAPNLDELTRASAGLRPQTGLTHEWGVRHRPSDALAWSATFFDIRNRDEITFGYDALSNQELNRNLAQPTHRRGVELGLSWRAVPAVQLQAQVTHLRARLGDRGFDVPLVARNTASLAVQWQIGDGWRGTLAGRFVGPRGDGSVSTDGSPLWPSLRAHDVWDVALHRQVGHLSWALGVRNLFDEVYSTTGYASTRYPMPRRRVHAELSWGF